jgi:hypothetical protein
MIPRHCVTLDRILYNHSLIEIDLLERLVLEAGGTVPAPVAPVQENEPAPKPDPDDGPISTGSPGVCCPENQLGKDGKCTGCGTVLVPELRARYLHLLRDEIERDLGFDVLPHDGVRIVNVCGGYVVVVVPRSGDLPAALVEHLMGEAAL